MQKGDLEIEPWASKGGSRAAHPPLTTPRTRKDHHLMAVPHFRLSRGPEPLSSPIFLELLCLKQVERSPDLVEVGVKPLLHLCLFPSQLSGSGRARQLPGPQASWQAAATLSAGLRSRHCRGTVPLMLWMAP